MVNEIFEKLSALPQVEAIALGGSRANGVFDEKSDYDVYVYVTDNIDNGVRENILAPYCSQMEIGNHYWEFEDNIILKDGVPMDIIYRPMDKFDKFISYIVFEHHANHGYTTCFWHNIITSQIVYDPSGKYAKLKKKFTVPYPEELRQNIIDLNMKMLSGILPSYDKQIKKAIDRNDFVSVNHRTAAFVASYFDVIFAVNRLTHPGEKRLVQICKERCEILPKDFEENLDKLLKEKPTEKIMEVIADMVKNLKEII